MDPRNQREHQDPNGRMYLNFGHGEQNLAADMGRAFPTTPSTFPQPMFPNQYGQRETWGTQQQTSDAYGGSSYFANNPYQSQTQTQTQQQQQQQSQPQQQRPQQQQQLAQHQQQQAQAHTQVQFQQYQNLPNPAALRSPTSYNDGTNGLVHQFSNQHLGGTSTPRSESPFARQPSPSSQPRHTLPQLTQQYGSHLTPHAPGPNGHARVDDELPIKNPEKYSDNVFKRAKVSTESVGTFFKVNVQRARDRNQRAKELEQYIQDPNISHTRKEQKRHNTRRGEAQYLRFLRTKEKASNFQTVRIIGKGAFGEVKLVTRTSDGKIYALKSLVKSEMYKRDQLAHVRSERDILAESDSPWVVKLYTTFQDPSFLYMLMEFLPGGDLMTMLIKYEIFSEDITRFYMAELTLAIEAVHKLGFIHRDIKPDNILLDRNGHIKLSDFGLSTGFHKEHDQSYYQQLIHGKAKSARDNRQSVTFDQIQLTVSNRSQVNTWRKSRRQLAYSTVGTPDYIAPEIFTGRGYDFACDWWSVGTIMFECLVGWPPFCGVDNDDVYRKIVNWRHFLQFPPEQPLATDAEEFMRGLMCDVDDRLGHLGGAAEIKKHRYFQGVDWSSLRKIRAPFEPKLSSNIDTQYFPDDIPQHDTTAAVRARDAGIEDAAEMSLPFIGYTFKRFDAFRAG